MLRIFVTRSIRKLGNIYIYIRCHVSRVDEAIYTLEIDYKRNILASINIPNVRETWFFFREKKPPTCLLSTFSQQEFSMNTRHHLESAGLWLDLIGIKEIFVGGAA